MKEHGKFNINPGPLKIVKQKHLATQDEIEESVRCKAIKTNGERCTRTQAMLHDYCWQHIYLEKEQTP
jgi:hypothetical protein